MMLAIACAALGAGLLFHAVLTLIVLVAVCLER